MPTPRRALVTGLTLAALALAAWGRGAQAQEKEKPVVVLIGDSIRLGYAPYVAERLKGVAEVVSPEENGGDTANVLKNLDEWAVRRKPAVVHLNAGLHDLKTDPKTGAKQVAPDAYRANLDAILKRLESDTAARLVFATTTPVIDERHQARTPFQFARYEADVEAYNRAALGVLADHRWVALDDLHALAVKLGPEKALGKDGVHFTDDAYRALGEQVAASVAAALRDPPATREAVCRRAAKPPTIDGKLDDPVWESAAVIDRFPSFWAGVDNGPVTRARLLWDDDALYFSATMTDAELRSFGTKHNDHLWNGDVFEFFLKPFDDRPEYYEFQVNPKSVLFEAAFPKRGADVGPFGAMAPLGMTAVATNDGTLDHPGDRDTGWSAEGRIPWSAFSPTGGRPAPGAVWRFAFCRFDYGPEGTKPVLMSSAPLRRASFHRYEDYGSLRFEGAAGR
jgi:lysophospholipase L1-like esterase